MENRMQNNICWFDTSANNPELKYLVIITKKAKGLLKITTALISNSKQTILFTMQSEIPFHSFTFYTCYGL